MKTDDEIQNEKNFMDMLARIRPDLWSVEVYRQELGFGDVGWLKQVLKKVFDIYTDSAYGDVVIMIRGKKGKLTFKKIEIERVEEEIFS